MSAEGEGWGEGGADHHNCGFNQIYMYIYLYTNTEEEKYRQIQTDS